MATENFQAMLCSDELSMLRILLLDLEVFYTVKEVGHLIEMQENEYH